MCTYLWNIWFTLKIDISIFARRDIHICKIVFTFIFIYDPDQVYPFSGRLLIKVFLLARFATAPPLQDLPCINIPSCKCSSNICCNFSIIFVRKENQVVVCKGTYYAESITNIQKYVLPHVHKGRRSRRPQILNSWRRNTELNISKMEIFVFKWNIFVCQTHFEKGNIWDIIFMKYKYLCADTHFSKRKYLLWSWKYLWNICVPMNIFQN